MKKIEIRFTIILVYHSYKTMNQKKGGLFFFRPSGYDGYLSNFYPSVFSIDKIVFTCSEQAFMYHKCKYFDENNDTLLSEILHETNPNKIKKLGRSVRNFDDVKWNQVKYDVMLKCVRNKFIQNHNIKEKLLETHPKQLYEASPWDKIWGIGYDKETAIRKNPNRYGQNLVGKVLMEIRDEHAKN